MSEDEDDHNPYWLDTEATKKLTGQYVNRLYIQHHGEGLLRLNFGEVLDVDDPSYHTALVVSAKNAISFAELLYQMAQAAMAAASPPAAKQGQADANR